MVSDEILCGIRNLVDYLYHDEEKHFHECEREGRKNHIFRDVKKVKEWFDSENDISAANNAKDGTMFGQISDQVKDRGWKEQSSGIIGSSGSYGTNFYKDEALLSISIVNEGHVTYPDEDELKEMFGKQTFRAPPRKTRRLIK